MSDNVATVEQAIGCLNSGDLEGYMRGYVQSDALVFTSGSKVRKGWAETYAKYKARYGNDKATMGTLAFEVLAVVCRCGCDARCGVLVFESVSDDEIEFLGAVLPEILIVFGGRLGLDIRDCGAE